MENPAFATVVWGGDVVLARRQHYLTQHIGADRVLNLPTLRAADLSIVNLECVIATVGEQGVDKGEGGPFYFRGRPELLRILAYSGVRAVTTANNHCGDYGPEAVIEQLQWLDRAGLQQAGTGHDKSSAFRPTYCRAGNINVALLSIDTTQASFAATDAGPGTAYLSLKAPETWQRTLEPVISEARRKAHVVLVAVHWGENFVHAPTEAARTIGRILVDSGADAVLGSSAHVLQGVEIYRERPIIYDAGNLLFDSIRSKPDDCGLFKLDINENGVSALTFVPVAGYTGYSEERTGEDAQAACKRFDAKCKTLGTVLTSSPEGRLQIDLNPPQRSSHQFEPVAVNTPKAERIPARTEVGDHWRVSTVPNDASCEPTPIGPMTLLGLRVWPKLIQKREMLWIESFWCVDEVIEDDIRIEMLASPVTFSSMRPWGERTDHDPCDWLLPTSRWVPKQIYRDLYGLRPPYLEDWENVDLNISIHLVTAGKGIDSLQTDQIIRLDVPDQLLRRAASKTDTEDIKPVQDTSARHNTTGGTPTTQPTTPRVSQGLRPPNFEEVQSLNPLLTMSIVIGGQVYSLKTGPTEPLDVLKQALTSNRPGQATHAVDGWSAKALQEATGGTWSVLPPPGWYAPSFDFSSDLRTTPMPMFVAFSAVDRSTHENSTAPRAPIWDRHDRLPRVSAEGTHCGAIVARVPTGVRTDFPMLIVPDPLKAAMQLGLVARKRFSGPVIAVTGTAGKSTTAMMLATMLGPDRTLCTAGNFNTRVGTLLTLANLNSTHIAAVIEVAQSALWMKNGPITRSIGPTVSLITSIGLSQTNKGISTTADVAKWKSRVFDGLTSSKLAVFPDFVDGFELIKDMAALHASRRVVFGYSDTADVKILSISAGSSGMSVDLKFPSGTRQITIPVLSRGMAENAVAALTVLYALGYDLDLVARRLLDLPQEDGRMQLRQIALAGGGCVEIIDDSWNAEVSSMVNALDFTGDRTPGLGGRRIGILGRIVHLGDMAPELHASLAEPVMRNEFNLVFTHGPEMKYLREKLPAKVLGPHFTNARALVDYVSPRLVSGDLLLIKGSRRDSDFGSIPGLLVASAHFSSG
jgi:UDP-N-acetylmuramyl pentapeptide synthase/poly-gamma-glutamate capsule biosynthesis protein CapA/YwtB (metallophosphatase superfamily)